MGQLRDLLLWMVVGDSRAGMAGRSSHMIDTWWPCGHMDVRGRLESACDAQLNHNEAGSRDSYPVNRAANMNTC